jgi:CBS domain-containing protein
MIKCRLCDHENLKGDDFCVHCGHPFVDDHLPAPRTAVERGVLGDAIAVLSPKAPITVSSQTSVRDVLKLLVDRHIGCVFIVDGETISGVFSERDALLRLNTQATAVADEPISRFMTPNPQSLRQDAKIAFAVHQMDLGGYRHLPIVDEQGRAEGVISVRDILRYLTQKMSEAPGLG